MTSYNFATKVVHEGYTPEQEYGSIMPPIYMTSTFKQEHPGETKGYDYTRAGNPNFTMLETLIASLEEGAFGTVFSSGLGALTALISTLSPGDQVLALDGVYGGTWRLFTKVFKQYGIEFKSIPFTNLNDLEAHLTKKPKWLFFESITNPLLEVYDVKALALLAKKHGVKSIVDNTFATPYYLKPLQLGADVVWHSATKYLGGHSDVVGGVVITNDVNLHDKLKFARMAIGLNGSPFDCWLLMRGIKTLALRMERHTLNAKTIKERLQNHPKVKKIYYPGLSGIVSIESHLSLDETKTMISSYKLFSLAESLGGVESPVCHPASMTHASIPKEERARIGLSDSLARYSVGIEDAQDLIQDLARALC